MDFLLQYGLFLAKTATWVIAIIVLVAVILMLVMRQKQRKGELEISNLSEQLDETQHRLQSELLSGEEQKLVEKKRKKAQKKAAKERKQALKQQDEGSERNQKSRLFVLDFKGSIDAKEVRSLREEVSAVLAIASSKDEVLVRLESGGGVVHGYGLAASQLQRIRDRHIPLTVSVDKVAASGGYMMACVAEKILAAPFAIIGSIGVIAQLPNFNRLLKRNDIDFEQHTAGEFKRTLTMFGENSDKGRAKFREDLEAIHGLFKDFVGEHRPELELSKVATGEYWFGRQALKLGLIDTIQTSDEYLLSQHPDRTLVGVRYVVRKRLADKLSHSVSLGIERAVARLATSSPFSWLR
ncbi:protease SohB [Dongshaea marina]|uniref:protease SohB n=1 Tax=Dongshaea marina TaxID=2047966 RepID=UPI000D3E74CD|nr:protease SohB [Dongshaea marina]